MRAVLAPVLLAVLPSGCSSQQAYHAGQVWQRNQCDRIIDNQERSRCLASAGPSYADYRRRQDQNKNP